MRFSELLCGLPLHLFLIDVSHLYVGTCLLKCKSVRWALYEILNDAM